MRMRISIILTLLLSCFSGTVFSQIERLGFEGEAMSVRVYNDRVFASSADGIWFYDLNRGDGWKRYCLHGEAVFDFLLLHDTVVAGMYDRILYSQDKGASFSEINLGEIKPQDSLYYIEVGAMQQSITKPERMIISIQSPSKEISWFPRTFVGISDDAGATWNWTCPFELKSHQGIDGSRITIDPMDDDHIFVYGESMLYQGAYELILETSDLFQTTYSSYMPHGYKYGEYEYEPLRDALKDIVCMTPMDSLSGCIYLGNNPIGGIICMDPDTRNWNYLGSKQEPLFDAITSDGNRLYGIRLCKNASGTQLEIYESNDFGITWKLLESSPMEGSENWEDWYFMYLRKRMRTTMYQGKIIIYKIDDIYIFTPPTNHIIENAGKKEANDAWYNTMGLRTPKPERGNIYIKNHKKYLIR